MLFSTFILFYLQYSVNGYNAFFNHWTCIGIKENIDIKKPYSVQIGDLPLVVWKEKEKWISAINICKHMGSKLDTSTIKNGCLKCPYHGLEYNYEDRIGETIEHNGKIFWAYKPGSENPPSVPFYNNPQYTKSFIQIDMEASLSDSAYNTMDIRHPEYVHNKFIGFGSTIPPKNVKCHEYLHNSQIGLSFDYISNKMMKTLNDNTKMTTNYHMFKYPSSSWSRVSFDDKHLIIGVNLLPLENKKTRWYVTLCHNYYTTGIGKEFMKFLANSILHQDYDQMKNQYNENKLKKHILFNHIFKDEEIMIKLNGLFHDYQYPDIDSAFELYQDYSKNK